MERVSEMRLKAIGSGYHEYRPNAVESIAIARELLAARTLIEHAFFWMHELDGFVRDSKRIKTRLQELSDYRKGTP